MRKTVQRDVAWYAEMLPVVSIMAFHLVKLVKPFSRELSKVVKNEVCLLCVTLFCDRKHRLHMSSGKQMRDKQEKEKSLSSL